MSKPTLLIISATIRRDLHRPFRRFAKFRVVHAYHDAAYGDLEAKDLGEDTRQYASIGALAQLISKLKPDLIQAPEPVASRLMLRAAWVVWRYYRRTGTPYFFPSFENLPLTHKFGPVMGLVMGQIVRRYATDAAWIYVLNDGARQTLEQLGAPTRKLIRANWGNWGIDRTEFCPAKSPPKERVNHPVVLFVGRLSTAKGVDTLIDAWTMVRTELPTAELWFVGPTNLDRGNQTLIERVRATPGVKLIGSKKQRELPAIFRHAWVTVLLSRTTTRWAEQVGMVNLQSLACGTPVVTTNSGSIPEYLSTKHGAVIVPENDATAAATAILGVLQDPASRETMGQAGATWIRDTFDEATAVPALEAQTFDRWQALKKDGA